MTIHDICFQHHLQSAQVLAAMPSQCFPMAWEMCGKMGCLVELRQRVGLDSGHVLEFETFLFRGHLSWVYNGIRKYSQIHNHIILCIYIYV